MKELIPINSQENGIQTVNARDLHRFLESKQDYSTWIKGRIDQYDFAEDVDFVLFHNSVEKGRPRIDYHISIDMAKELSMVEKNDQGKKARRYFIECERIALQQNQQPQIQVPTNFKEAIQQLLIQLETTEKLTAKIEADKHKVKFAEQIENSERTVDFGDFAKAISRKDKFVIGRNKLYAFLRDAKVLMNGYNKRNLPFQKYIDMGWFEVTERSYEHDTSNGPRSYLVTLITGKGQIGIVSMLRKHFGLRAA